MQTYGDMSAASFFCISDMCGWEACRCGWVVGVCGALCEAVCCELWEECEEVCWEP